MPCGCDEGDFDWDDVFWSAVVAIVCIALFLYMF